MRNIEIVELLLDKGAKVSALDKVLLKTHLHLTHDCIMLFIYFSDVEVSFFLLSSLRKETHPSTLPSEGEAESWLSCC